MEEIGYVELLKDPRGCKGVEVLYGVSDSVCDCEDLGSDTWKRWVWHEEKANHLASNLGEESWGADGEMLGRLGRSIVIQSK